MKPMVELTAGAHFLQINERIMGAMQLNCYICETDPRRRSDLLAKSIKHILLLNNNLNQRLVSQTMTF